MTPWVARPMPRISVTTRVRISTPPVVISMISSSSLTSLAATMPPLRSLAAMAMTPLGTAPGMAEIANWYACQTVLGGDQHGLLLVIGHEQRNHRLPWAAASCPHAASLTAHGADVLLVEPDRLAAVGDGTMSFWPLVSSAPIR